MPVSQEQSQNQKTTWVPMIAIALGQVLMSFNVASLPVALGGIVKTFSVPATTVATAVVMYSLSVAGFVMLGAKLNQRFGATWVFRIVIMIFGLGQAIMALSPSAPFLFVAQGLCGLAGAALVPSLVALIANHYSGPQQATALGALGSARAGAGVMAFVIGGVLGTFISWRYSFGLMAGLSLVVLALSAKLKVDNGRPDTKIDFFGVLLAASSIILISFGFNNLNRWGLTQATGAAPFDVLGFSPAPMMIVIGIVLAQLFISWTMKRQEKGLTPLLDLRVIGSGAEKAAVLAMFSVVALEAALNFSVPLYIQIVQGRTPMATAVAMMPFNLSVFFSALLVIRLYDRLTPRQIGQYGFGLCAVALFWLAYVVKNDWNEVPVLLGLILFGIGQGALVTLLFNVLMTGAPKDLAGDVGSLRGTANNLASAVGTAVASGVLVAILSSIVLSQVAEHPVLTPYLQEQLNLDQITFVSNDRLRTVLEGTTATSEQVSAAISVNVNARLRALKFALLMMAALSLLSIVPARRLPVMSKNQ